MERAFIGYINPPNLITLLGLALAFLAAFFAHNSMLPAAMLCYLHCAVCDGLDGIVARRMALSTNARAFGGQLDSLVDMACYGMAPASIALSVGLDSSGDFILFFLLSSCAAFRLAHFNCHGSEKFDGKQYYTGMPSTYTSLLLPAAYTTFVTSPEIAPWIIRLAHIGIALLFVLKLPIVDVRYSKLTLVYYASITGFWLYHLAT